MSGKPPPIIPGPPGFVLIALADLAQLLEGVKPDPMPRTVYLRYRSFGRETLGCRVQLTRYQVGTVDLYGFGGGDDPPGAHRIELTLE